MCWEESGPAILSLGMSIMSELATLLKALAASHGQFLGAYPEGIFSSYHLPGHGGGCRYFRVLVQEV